MNMKRNAGAWLAAAVVLASGIRAHGLINPNFTPGHLFRASELLLVVKVGPVDEKTKLSTLTVQEALVNKQGQKQKTLTMNLNFLVPVDEARMIKMFNDQGDEPALLFSGTAEDGRTAGFMHIASTWIDIQPAKEKETEWEANGFETKAAEEGMGMNATWHGGTDKLLRVIRHMMEHPDLLDRIPVDGGTSWENHVKIDTVPGKIHVMRAVDLAGNGENALFIGAQTGDRVYRWNKGGGSFDNATESLGLTTRSQVAAWGNFAGNGRLDLMSWDGESLSLWVQDDKGAFARRPITSGAPEGACVSMQALELGVAGKAGVLWIGAAGVSLMIPDPKTEGGFRLQALSATEDKWSAMGKPGKGMAADFTNNGIVDVLVVGEAASLFFTGEGPGRFASAREIRVGSGPGFGDAFFGDWNADGWLDVFTLSTSGRALWENTKDGKFVNKLGLTGELSYISSPGGVMGATCDFNNDGRQDIYIAYGKDWDHGPQLFFNRWYRSFGHAHAPVDIGELDVIPGIRDGQQAGLVADLNHNGVQDMAFVKTDGEVYVFIRDYAHGSNLAAVVGLSPKAGHSGPVRVWAHNGIFPLGAWSVEPGVQFAFLGVEDPGPLEIHWQFPGQEPQKTTRLMESGFQRIWLEPAK